MLSKKKSKNRIAIMGGGFDPFHFGHKNVITTIQKQFQIDTVFIIPAYQAPLKEKHISAQHRLNMLKQVFAKNKNIIVDEQEILRKGVSYSYKTCLNIVKKNPKADCFLIIGMDQLQIFHQWKNFSKILADLNLIVTSRSGLPFFKRISEFPKKMQLLLKKKIGTKIYLKNSRKVIYFCQLKDRKISSSLIRQKLGRGDSIKSLAPLVVRDYIEKHKLYPPRLLEKKLDSDHVIKKRLQFCKKELENKQAFDVEIYDFKNKNPLFSACILASCSNTTQVKALSKYIKKRLQEEYHLKSLGE
ncbi:MAG: nicotinate (nicotinamide) nucleotide adenylyltransferase, partial [Bdellovibrionales bacterium]